MKKLPSLTRDEISRYSRQILLPEISMRGQQKMKAASVLLVGVGGLGSPIALYLAAAGVGRIGLVDADTVDISNLQRQVIHSTQSQGAWKVESARKRMLELNPQIRVETYATRIDHTNAEEISRGYDILVDGTDNIPSRYLLNDLAVLTHRPFVYGSIYRFEGQVSVFGAADGPCYRCMFPEPPPPGMVPSCSTAGVLGALPGLIGSIQAAETIKLITGCGRPLSGKLLLVDAIDMTFDRVNIRKRPGCKICGEAPEITSLIDYEQWCGDGPGQDPGSAGDGLDIEPLELKQLIEAHTPLYLLDVREEFEKFLTDLDGAVNIPLLEISGRLAEIPRDRLVIAYCRNGIRSAEVTRELSRKGFSMIKNLHGGINAWARQVDPEMQLY